jgi:hypothetical protein
MSIIKDEISIDYSESFLQTVSKEDLDQSLGNTTHRKAMSREQKLSQWKRANNRSNGKKDPSPFKRQTSSKKITFEETLRQYPKNHQTTDKKFLTERFSNASPHSGTKSNTLIEQQSASATRRSHGGCDSRSNLHSINRTLNFGKSSV